MKRRNIGRRKERKNEKRQKWGDLGGNGAKSKGSERFSLAL